MFTRCAHEGDSSSIWRKHDSASILTRYYSDLAPSKDPASGCRLRPAERVGLPKHAGTWSVCQCCSGINQVNLKVTTNTIRSIGKDIRQRLQNEAKYLVRWFYRGVYKYAGTSAGVVPLPTPESALAGTHNP